MINGLARPEIFADTLVDRRCMMGANTGDKIGVCGEILPVVTPSYCCRYLPEQAIRCRDARSIR